ncbi:histidine kinase [Lachnospiraceae bacterium ZAX-1]
MKGLFRKADIFHKLFRSHMMLAVILIFVFLTTVCVFFTVTIQQKNQFFMDDVVNLNAKRLNELTDTMKSCSNAVMFALNQQGFLDDTSNDTELARYNKITRQLSLMCQVYKNVDSLVYVTMSGKVYSNQHGIGSALNSSSMQPYQDQLESNSTKPVCFGVVLDDGLSTIDDEPVLLVGKKIIRITDGVTLGFLYIAIQGSHVVSVYGDATYTPGTVFYLSSMSGAVLSSNAPSDGDANFLQAISESSQMKTSFFNGGNYFLSYKIPISSMDAFLICVIPIFELYDDLIVIVTLVFAIGIAGIVVSVKMARRLSYKISTPICRLTFDMYAVESGDISLRSFVRTDDEIGTLATGFNKMLDQINVLIDTIKQEQKQKGEVEMALLQNQIKPHFLYNALNTIHSLCLIDEPERAAEAAESLARHYRANLSGGHNIITLKDELAGVEGYFDIQRIRYSSHLLTGIICDADAQSARLPKMTIQPIVENAVEHGVRPKGNGNVLVQVKKIGGDIFIEVIDDGIGMNEKVMKHILTRESHTGFGLKNVNERLQKFTQTSEPITIESKEGLGTTVTVRVSKGGACSESVDC